jgi:hypothetical protein
MRALAVGLLGILGVASCGDSGKALTGSICAIYDCSFDTVTIRKQGETTIRIDYSIGPVTQSELRTAVVVCDVANFVKGQEVPATDVRHIAPDGVGFPTLAEAACVFNDDLVVGAHVSGSFHARFVTEAGTERALNGDFDGTLEAAQ